MLKIRLMRIGAKKRPFYRVVAVDERAKRTGGYLELLGTYNPITNPKDIKLNQTRIDYWTSKGAVLSDGYLRMTGKAPPRPARPAKKGKKAAAKPKQEVPKPSEEETVQKPNEEAVEPAPTQEKEETTKPPAESPTE